MSVTKEQHESYKKIIEQIICLFMDADVVDSEEKLGTYSFTIDIKNNAQTTFKMGKIISDAIMESF
jgi:hypothetical protein